MANEQGIHNGIPTTALLSLLRCAVPAKRKVRKYIVTLVIKEMKIQEHHVGAGIQEPILCAEVLVAMRSLAAYSFLQKAYL